MTSSSSSSSLSTSGYGNGSQIQVSGLVSGLDTSSIISELMAVAAIPQQQEQTRLNTENSKLSTMQSLNTAIAGLASSAQTFESGSTWTQLAATSSNSAITVTAASTAVQSTLNVVVNNLASGATYQMADANSSTDSSDSTFTSVWQAGHTYTISDGSTPPNTVTFTLPPAGEGTGPNGDISPEDVASAMQHAVSAQASATNTTPQFSATVAHTSFDSSGNSQASGDYLELAAIGTGTQTNFTITDNGTDTTGQTGTVIASTDGSSGTNTNATVAAGQNALLTINGNLQVSSASNSGIEVEDGVTLSLGANAANTTNNGNQATISLSDNGGSRAAAVQSFVSQVNSVLSTIYSDTSYGTIPTTASSTTYTQGSSATSNAATGAGPLAGDPTVRGIADNLINSIFPADGTSMANLGISVTVNADGTSSLSFDSSAFTAAYKANPVAVTQAFSGGASTTGTDIVSGQTVTVGSFASRIQDAAVMASANGTTTTFSNGTVAPAGSMTAAITNENSTISTMQADIANWTTVLQQRQQSLETTYSSLEVSLSNLQSQSSWLASQISGLQQG